MIKEKKTIIIMGKNSKSIYGRSQPLSFIILSQFKCHMHHLNPLDNTVYLKKCKKRTPDGQEYQHLCTYNLGNHIRNVLLYLTPDSTVFPLFISAEACDQWNTQPKPKQPGPFLKL